MPMLYNVRDTGAMTLLACLKGKVTVEPVVLVYFATMVFSSCLSTNLLLFKACDPTGAIAQRTGSKCENEKAAQHVVAPINGWKALAQQLVPIVLIMFAGTWSDRHGRRRRPLVVLPIAGQILSDALSLYCTVRWSVSPVMTAVAHAAAVSCTGGAPMLFNGVNSHVADTTPAEWRTVKYGVLGGTIAVGAILGMLVYGFAVANLGLATAFAACVCLGLAAMAMAFAFVVDDADQAPWPVDELPLYQKVMRTVDPTDVLRNCCRVLTKRRQGHSKLILCVVILACAPLTCVPLEGEMSVMYLFLRYKFHWDEVNFSIFNAYQMTIVLLGTLFALGILSHKFKMNDALIGTIASVFDLFAATAFFFVSQPWQLFLVPPLELFRGAALALTSSIASKCVGPDELGTMNSIKLFMESTIKCGFIPLYNFIYNHTFESMPSAFFLITIGLTFPLVFCFGLIYYIDRKPRLSPYEENKKGKNEISPINDCDVINYDV